MAAFSTRLRYGAVAQFFHWATAILVVAAFVYGPGGSEQQVYSLAKDFDRQIHETLGIGVLGVVLIRLAFGAHSMPRRTIHPCRRGCASRRGSFTR